MKTSLKPLCGEFQILDHFGGGGILWEQRHFQLAMRLPFRQSDRSLRQ